MNHKKRNYRGVRKQTIEFLQHVVLFCVAAKNAKRRGGLTLVARKVILVHLCNPTYRKQSATRVAARLLPWCLACDVWL